MKKLILTISLLFLFIINPVLADRSPVDELCNLYGGRDNGNVCYLESGDKCDPLDTGFILNNEEIQPCNQYATIPCAKHGESVNLNECCEGLKRTTKKSYYTEECKKIIPIGGTTGICLNCGDGVCDESYESICNCPEDCQQSIFKKIIAWFKNLFS